MNYNENTINKLYHGSRLINVTVNNGSGSTLPENIESWELDSFGKPTSIVVKNGVTSIPRDFQHYNTSLSSCTLPNSVTSIGNDAFSHIIPTKQSVDLSSTLASGLTSGCQNMFSSSNLSGDYFVPSALLQLTTSGSSLVSNCYQMFYQANSMYTSNPNRPNVEIGEGATNVANSMFSWGRFNTVTLPSTIVYIDNDAFSYSYISSLTIKATTPPTLFTTSGYNWPFYNNNITTIYVPSSALSTYKSTDGWSSLSSKLQAIP